MLTKEQEIELDKFKKVLSNAIARTIEDMSEQQYLEFQQSFLIESKESENNLKINVDKIAKSCYNV